MSKSLEDEIIYTVKIVNPYAKEYYFLKGATNEILAFEDRNDAIASARKHIRRRFRVGYFKIYEELQWRFEAASGPVRLIPSNIK